MGNGTPQRDFVGALQALALAFDTVQTAWERLGDDGEAEEECEPLESYPFPLELSEQAELVHDWRRAVAERCGIKKVHSLPTGGERCHSTSRPSQPGRKKSGGQTTHWNMLQHTRLARMVRRMPHRRVRNEAQPGRGRSSAKPALILRSNCDSLGKP